MAEKNYLAVDIGASSGRHILGHVHDQHLQLEETYRFENGMVDLGGTLYWDAPALWKHVQNGIRQSAAISREIVSIGVDTWGVDFALLDKTGHLLSNPVAYRDHRTDGMPEAAFEQVSRETIFAQTGLQFMQFNTLYQWIVMRRSGDPLLEMAHHFLQIPDLFHWLLSGEYINEFTNATTTQFFHPQTGTWAFDLLKAFDLPTHFLGEVTPPGTNLGGLRPSLEKDLGVSMNVVLPGTHDTASAVLAVPAQSKPGEKPNWCYISLGTWALMGIESPQPIINQRVADLNFTNEGGVGNTYRVLKNITGMWILQECRRIWNQSGKNWSWGDLTAMAEAVPPLQSFIDPEAKVFFAPENMVAAIQEFCSRTGQKVPQTEGEILRCAMDSIAMRFRQVFQMCEEINESRIETIHIVGGGTQNRSLCQAAANATGRMVITGPIEATAIGNILMQAIADGVVSDIQEARQMVRNSFPMEVFMPQDTDRWEEGYRQYRQKSMA